jgi:rhodanese-related sulfurtransferase
MRKILLEIMVVAAAGLSFSLAANRISPRGLVLTRDYFPGVSGTASSAAASASKPAGAPGAGALPAVETLATRLKNNGLQLADSNLVSTLFRDPRYEQELVVFVDSRADRDYQAGHIPGAYQLDHYHFENYLPGVLPVCQTAEQVVIYCNGGDCDDSQFAAITLRDAGIPAANLFVYAGGMAEWSANGLPVERGARKSGDLLPGKP